MSQRNPMNDRYQTDERRGQTRKSAAAMKPKTKAAATVRVAPPQKTKQQKKAEKKVARAKQAELDRKYYNPPTPQYKRLRKVWWGLLIGAILLTVLSWFGRTFLPEAATYITLGLAYACIIGALYVDFSKIRKVRRAYQEEMENRKSKEQRALEKQQKAQQKSLKEQEADKAEDAEAEKPKKRSLFGSGFRLSKAEEAKAEKQASKKGQAEGEGEGADTGAGAGADEGEFAFKRAKADAAKAEKAAKEQAQQAK